ncbi:hypothetical protein FHG87_003298 [Trinorchestia longiramus]|nr:hypothetical protein FHG87_003298 [Trinorchestia longiramus]
MDNIVTKPSSAVEAPETIYIKSEEPVDESKCTVKDEPFDWLSETQVLHLFVCLCWCQGLLYPGRAPPCS